MTSAASAKGKKNDTIYDLIYNAQTFLCISSVKLPSQSTYTSANTPSQNIPFLLTTNPLKILA